MAKKKTTKQKPAKPATVADVKQRDARIGDITTAIKAGSYREVAAAWLGVAGDELARMVADGSIEQELMQAESQFEIRLVGEIAKAANVDWRAAKWLLEQRFPTRWGKLAPGERRGYEVEPTAVVASQPPDEVEAAADPLAGVRLLVGS